MKLLENRSRLAALLLLLGAAVAIEEFAVTPLMHLYAERQSKLASLRVRAARVATQAADGPGLSRELAAFERSGKASAVFWPGETNAVAAAGLQERIRATLQQAGAAIDETEALAPAAEGALRRITLKVRFSADIDQAERVVHAIESMTPALVVDHLAIHALNSPRPDAAELGVELRVFGYADPSAKAPTS